MMSIKKAGTDRRALLLFAAGLAGVGLTEWRAWRRDQAQPAVDEARQTADHPAGPRVSILVAAWNERRNLARLLESFAVLRYPDRELVLCAGGQDGTYERAVALAGPRVRVLEQQSGEGKWRALGRCLEQATGEIIFLTDADCAVSDAAFEATLAPVLWGEVAAATGSSLPFPEDEARSPLIAYQGEVERYLLTSRGTTSLGLHGRNCAVRRSALETAGGFSGQVATGTDYALAARLRAAGFSIGNVPGSIVRSEYHGGVRDYWRQRSRWLRNLVVHGATAGDWGEVRHALVTGVLGVALLGGPVAGFVAGPVITALWGVLFVKATAARVRRRAVVRQRDAVVLATPAWWVLLAPLWTLVDAAAWTLTLLDLMAPSRRRRW